MVSAIVGYSGFVGSNLLQFYKFDYFYNSSNFHEAINGEYDTIFFCGVPAVKWYANKNPDEDSTVLHKIKSILETIKVKKIILISTIDVYEYVDSQETEDYDCDFINNHAYGRNRYLFESFIKKNFDNYYIIRLPALFGKGLKKNVIYDLINNNQIENIEKNTKFQWYNLDWLKNDIDIAISNNIRICNLFTEPLETLDIVNLFYYPLDMYKTQSTMTYNLKTKYSSFFNSNINGYIRDKNTVLNSIKDYLNFNKIDKTNLVVSNICIKHISQLQFSCILKLFGIKNVQIAPTTLIGTWDKLDDINFELYSKNNINVYSFQSITYGLIHNIFDTKTQETLFNHITKVIDCGIKNNIKIFVFGCPKNRNLIDLVDMDSNNELFIDFFRKIGDYIGDNELKICIENNSKQYGCNYLNTISEVGDIVTKINQSNIKMMVDIGNAIMENDSLDDIYKYKNIIYNIDIARENMKPFIEYGSQHKEFIRILNDVNYDKKMNLEMVINATNWEDELDILTNSLNHFVNFIIDYRKFARLKTLNNIKIFKELFIDNNILYKTNISYIHFIREQQKNLYFNSHFLYIENNIYYVDIFVNENIINIIKNINSDDVNNFNNILQRNIYSNLYSNLYLNKAIILYINTLSPGHELATLTESIYAYYENKLFDFEIVITDQIDKLGKMFISMLYLFFDKSKIHFVNNFTVVNINETYLIRPTSSNKQDKIIKFLLRKINENLNELNYTKNIESLNELKDIEKLCIIKTTQNKTCNSLSNSFSKDYNYFFKENGFKIIIPEELCITELYYLIKNCKNLILSWGANSWVNSIFVNEKHNLITLCHEKYAIEYNYFKTIKNIEHILTQWTPICKKNIMIYDLKTELTETIKYTLTEKLKELINN